MQLDIFKIPMVQVYISFLKYLCDFFKLFKGNMEPMQIKSHAEIEIWTFFDYLSLKICYYFSLEGT